MNKSIYLVLGLLGIVACAESSSPSVESDAPEIRAGLSCALEILYQCKPGSFDGCTTGVTQLHACVAEADRKGGLGCPLEILRVCDPGFKDACTLTPMPANQHICVEAAASGSSSGSSGASSSGSSGSSGASSSGSSGSSSGSSGSSGVSCDLEILLVCAAGSFDGCTTGITDRHVCVDDDSRNENTSCALEILRACDAGFEDACIRTPSPSTKHVCVKK